MSRPFSARSVQAAIGLIRPIGPIGPVPGLTLSSTCGTMGTGDGQERRSMDWRYIVGIVLGGGIGFGVGYAFRGGG